MLEDTDTDKDRHKSSTDEQGHCGYRQADRYIFKTERINADTDKELYADKQKRQLGECSQAEKEQMQTENRCSAKGR